MLYIHTSNRLEKLSEALATIVTVPLPNPLDKEFIVVQSKGMERWVCMQLAQQLGVWANGYFPFPEAMLRRLFNLKIQDQSRFEREVMTWSLMNWLPSFLEKQQVNELHSYLQDQSPMKLYQLAMRLAATFDQYLVYRPRWIKEWETGGQPTQLIDNSQAQWQAALWRELIQRHGQQHWVTLYADFLPKLGRSPSPLRLPKRLSIFGISALPPFYLDVLAKLGQHLDIHVFLLNPCQEYWGDIVSDTDIAHKVARFTDKMRTPEDEYLETGNTLLATLGKLGRDFIDMLNEPPHVNDDVFEDPGETSLLRCIQTDILHLQERGDAKQSQDIENSLSQRLPPKIIEANDKSIQIHVCHSTMREVEVLHDQLLALFEENPDLLPKDVIVMMPDIETYAPFIQAVFTTTPEEKRRIPVSLADRSLRSQSIVIEAFFDILELSKGRFTVSEVLAVLEVEAVQRRFGFVTQDLPLIRNWIEQTGIRWGMDGESRKNMALPAFEENTWRAGLKRLLLGYALPQRETETLFQNLLPFAHIEGHEALTIGKLVAFVENLFEYVNQFQQPRSLPAWAEFLTRLLDRFFQPTAEGETELQQVRNVLNELVENGHCANFQQTVSSEVILAYLRQHLESEPLTTHFLTGQVTFCTLLPMRSIPFKVVCLLGMNDQTYPRANQSLGFDLITQYPQRGDRSRRHNDRYLFLEALLSARETLYISYMGHSIHDNTDRPPSVLVSGLLDYIKGGFRHPDTSNLLDFIVTHHPLQPFSPRYFNTNETRLFSYSTEYCQVSTALMTKRQRDHWFLANNRLPEPPPDWKIVPLDRLTEFFTHPIRFFLTHRLGLELPASAERLEESEPFEVQGLERYKLDQTLVEKSLEGHDLQEYLRIAKATGQLPHGRVGEYVYSQLISHIQPFVQKVRQTLQQDKIVTSPFQLTIGEMCITGQLRRLWRSHLIHYRCAKLKAKDYIRLWIHHLILNHLLEEGWPRHSLLIGEEEEWEYQVVNDSYQRLEELLAWYWQGLQQPLRFFPETSFTYAQAWQKTPEKANDQARTKWRGNGNEFALGEGEDEYYHWCFGRSEETPLDEQFQKLAKQFFEPLLTARKERS